MGFDNEKCEKGRCCLKGRCALFCKDRKNSNLPAELKTQVIVVLTIQFERANDLWKSHAGSC
jgi:uncharacterized Fe-S cluster protein YjdI